MFVIGFPSSADHLASSSARISAPATRSARAGDATPEWCVPSPNRPSRPGGYV